MKTFTKILTIILSLSLLCVPIVASSSHEMEYVSVDGGIKITTDACSQKVFDRIIRDLAPNDELQSAGALNNVGIQPMANILCIFGHSLETGYLTRTTHNAYSTAPRCKQEIYYFEICARGGCDYATYDLGSSVYIYCH